MSSKTTATKENALSKYLEGKKIKRKIFVKCKLINFIL